MDRRDALNVPLCRPAAALLCPPRLFSPTGPHGVVANMATLLLTGLLGTALVHLAAYHLRSGSTGAYLLCHCPWRATLLIVVVAALANGLLLRRELRALWREGRRLAAYLDGAPEAGTSPWLPRRSARLVILCCALYLLQGAGTAAALHLAPMHAPIVMGGHSMLMAVAPILPLPAIQALLSIGLGTVLWFLERRVASLWQVVASLRRLLAAIRMCPAAVPLAAGRSSRRPALLHGFHIFSRPPPLASPTRRSWGVAARVPTCESAGWRHIIPLAA